MQFNKKLVKIQFKYKFQAQHSNSNIKMLNAGIITSQCHSEQLRFSNQTPKNTRSRPKLFLLKQKDTFLTDPQTSDNTKSSNESNSIVLEMLEQKNRKLLKQNNQLKETIITMKANQFYTINEDRVKQAIQENQNLKAQIKRLNSIIQQIEIEKDYFVRNNELLKIKLGQTVHRQKSQRMKTQTSISQKVQELTQLRQSHKHLRHVTSNPNLLLSYQNYDSQYKNQKQNSNSNEETFEITYKIPQKSKDHLKRQGLTNRQFLKDSIRQSIKQNRQIRDSNRQIKQYKSQSRSRSKDLGGCITNLLKQRKTKKINPQKNKEQLNSNFNQEYFLGSTNQNNHQNNGSITLIRNRSKRY